MIYYQQSNHTVECGLWRLTHETRYIRSGGQAAVGADSSRPAPIYRPLLPVLLVKAHCPACGRPYGRVKRSYRNSIFQENTSGASQLSKGAGIAAFFASSTGLLSP